MQIFLCYIQVIVLHSSKLLLHLLDEATLVSGNTELVTEATVNNTMAASDSRIAPSSSQMSAFSGKQVHIALHYIGGSCTPCYREHCIRARLALVKR